MFKMNTDGSGYTVIKRFTGIDGLHPWGDLVFSGSALYGTTEAGGDLDYGVVFSENFLSIKVPPLTQPAEVGSTVTLIVEAIGSPSPHYQWYFNGTNTVVNATNSRMQLADVQFEDSAAYHVVVTNEMGSVTSAPAIFNVIAPVDRRFVAALKLTGQPGNLLGLEYTETLNPESKWRLMTTMTLTEVSELYFDFSPLPEQRFYRAWQAGAQGAVPSLDLHVFPAITLTGNIGDSVRLDYINVIGPTDAWVTLDTVTLTTSRSFTSIGWRKDSRHASTAWCRCLDGSSHDTNVHKSQRRRQRRSPAG